MNMKIMLGLVMGLLAGVAQAQTTYTWANSNVTGTPTANRDWFGVNKGTWIATDPLSGNLNTIQFFQNTTTALQNTAVPSTQAVNLNNSGTPFQLGTLTLSGKGSGTANAHLTMNLSGDALNFSAATGTINLDAINNGGRAIVYNVANNIELGTASLASTLTLTGNGNGNNALSLCNFSGSISALQVSGGSKLIKSGSSIATISGAVTISGGLEVNGGMLSLTGSANAITGGITLNNGGTLDYTSASTINGNNISVNGAATLRTGSHSSTDVTITLNSGANLSLSASNGSQTFSSAVTGAGSLTITRYGSGNGTYVLNSTANTFTGGITFSNQGNTLTLTVNSLADSASVGAGNIAFAGTNTGPSYLFNLGSGASAPLTLNNRRIEFTSTSTTGGVLANNSSQAFTINTDLLVSSTSTPTLALRGTGSGLSSFNGVIGNGSGTVGLTKSEGGTWVLSNTNNTYTGATQVQGGTLVVNKMANYSVNSSIGASASGPGITLGYGSLSGTLVYKGTGDSTDRFLRLGGSATILNNGTGALDFTAGTVEVTGSGTTTALIIGGSNGGSISGAIPDKNALSNQRTAITKTGIGTWVLGGTNTNTGATALNGGTLELNYSAQNNSKLPDAAGLNVGAFSSTLNLSGGSHNEIVASTSLANGAGLWITRTSGTSSVALNAISRANGQNAITLSEDSIASIDQTNGNGILGGWATVSNNWAVNSMNGADGAIIGLTSYTTTVPTTGGDTTANYQLTGSHALTGNLTGNSLRIVNGADSDILDMGSVTSRTLTPGSGHSAGILYVGGYDNNYTITGAGTVRSATANNTLNVNVYTGTLTVNALLNSGTAATVKYGAGTLVVGGNNVASGPFWVLDGTVRLTHNNAAGTTANGIGVQNGAVLELANSVAIGTEALTIVGTGVSNGGALRNVADSTSSYGGTVTIGDSGARINSDSGASLTLTNASSIVTALFRDVTIGGSGNTTVSGKISGAGNLIKDGSGTLTLSSTNTYSGATTINGGTLALGGHNVLNGKAMTLNSGTLDAGTYTNTLSTLTVSGSGSAIVMSPVAVLAFADSRAIAWSGTLSLTGVFTAGTSLRFGTSSAGLTPEQLGSLKATGYTLSLDANGYLTGRPSGTLIYFM